MTYQASRESLQVITTSDVSVSVIFTLVSAKQVYNGRVKLFSEIEPVPLRVCFLFHSSYIISCVLFSFLPVPVLHEFHVINV